MTEPIKILFLAANPKNMTQLRLEEEVKAIETKIQSAKYRRRFKLIPYHAVTPQALQEALLKHRPQIVHFSGHGSPRGIFLENSSTGRSQAVTAEALGDLFAINREKLCAVVMNACYSALRAGGISQIVDVTIGMLHEIGDQSAIEFSAAFYSSLAYGKSIQNSFDQAKVALGMLSIPGTHIPFLLRGLGKDPDKIYLASERPLKPLRDEPLSESEFQPNDGTMQVDVIVLQRNTIKKVEAWRYRTVHDQQFFVTLDEQERRLPLEDAWRELALRINQMACKNSGTSSSLALDVFLVLRGGFVENLADLECLRTMVQGARDHTWGSNIYVVWEQKPETKFELHRGNETTLAEWFSILLEDGVTDLIEITKKDRASKAHEYKILHDCAYKSETRRARLRKLVSSESWSTVLLDFAFYLEEFLDRFSTGEVAGAESKNLIVFYDDRPPNSWGQLIEKSAVFNRSGVWFVGTLRRRNELDHSDLDRLWKQESNKVHPLYFDSIFVFNGIFEWLYAVIRLKQAGRPTSVSPREDEPGVEWIEAAETTLLSPTPGGGDLRLLVTSTFSPVEEDAARFTSEGFLDFVNNQKTDCLAAAKEIGGVLRRVSFNVAVEVHHGIRSERLRHLLKNKLFTAWLFLGHRSSLKGLRDESQKQAGDDQAWGSCFELYGRRSVQLVILSMYDSSAIARMFASSGVRVAVGFANEVPVQTSQALSARVIPVALEPGDRQAAILSAFAEFRNELNSLLSAETNSNESGPTAFAVKPKS